MDFDAIIFIGPQGSGKGTQAKLFAQKLGFFYLGSGALFREIAARDDAFGRKVAAVMNRGELLDDETLFDLFKEKLKNVSPGEGIIFDGIPRRVTQAEHLMQFLKSVHRKRTATIFLSLTHGESVKRLMKRAEIEGRKDDTNDRIELRLAEYDRETVPVIAYLKERTYFMEIDGMPPPNDVTREIEKALGLKVA